LTLIKATLQGDDLPKLTIATLKAQKEADEFNKITPEERKKMEADKLEIIE